MRHAIVGGKSHLAATHPSKRDVPLSAHLGRSVAFGDFSEADIGAISAIGLLLFTSGPPL